jgi:hypothetical protein
MKSIKHTQETQDNKKRLTGDSPGEERVGRGRSSWRYWLKYFNGKVINVKPSRNQEEKIQRKPYLDTI